MKKDAKDIAKAFDLIGSACAEIKNYSQCEGCPLQHLCLEEEAAIEFADFINEGTWDEFLAYAENAEFKNRDYRAEYADFMRKYEEEERLIDEYYG